ncbi:hybrid sensor histidine kinase/response regulator transcription factor [Pleionea litopenaei]|uniref:histidine kinase n=1 Tax=Pleionea litopenaei TaxID=3070815 RepID=A0AA51RWL2_9GAMM|nr:ATP-binding protein [Pleionea sp. HL-JVS1]WMS89121.1 ATP-binding protein [Pleionea sp. HL-JVS1]
MRLITRLILLLLVSYWPLVSGLEPVMHFRHLHTQLSQVSVTDISQDSQGFIWLGTKDGLNRFDGHQVRTYLQQPQSDGAVGNLIKDLLTTSSGELIAISSAGPLTYSAKTDSFTYIETLEDHQNRQHVTSVTEDGRGNLWFATNVGKVLLLNQETKTLSEFPVNDESGIVHINQVIVGNEHTIWLASRTGLWVLDDSEENFQLVSGWAAGDKEKDRHPVESIALYRSNILIATYEGLYSHNVKRNESERVFSEALYPQVKDERVRSITVTEKNQVLLSTFDGLIELDFPSRQISKTGFLKNSQYHLPDSTVNFSYVDAQGILWVGTDRAGASFTQFNEQMVEHYIADNNLPECLSGNAIYSLTRDANDNLWVAVWGKGLHKINLKTQHCEVFDRHTLPLVNQALKSIVSMQQGSDHEWWFGTAGLGLLHFDGVKFNLFANANLPEDGLLNLDVFSIEKEGESLWLGTQGGLAKFDMRSHKFTHFSKLMIAGSERIPQIFNLLKQPNSPYLWIGTQHGLTRLNTHTGKVDLEKIPKALLEITSPIYRFYYTDSSHLLIGTGGDGLYDYNQDNVQHYTQQQGLPNNTVYAIEQDYLQNIWASTNQGVFNLSLNSQLITNYSVEQGLQANEFSTTSTVNLLKNKIYFAGLNGFNVITSKPEERALLSYSPVITEFFIDNSIVNTQEVSRYTQGLSIGLSNNIELSYLDKFVGFEFSALNYLSGNNTRYRYKLSGYHEQWLETPRGSRTASFSNLPSGSFQLIINATDASGQWSNKVTSITLNVAPPWWLSFWAKIAYILLIVVTPLVIFRYRSRSLLKRAADLEVAVRLRTKELAVQKSIVEKLLQQKNNEFINISHEFRTPLTLILGPVKRLLTHVSEEQKTSLKLIQTNAERLLKLVDELLEIEKLKVNKALPKQFYLLDGIVEDIVYAYEYAAQSAGLVFRSHVETGICVNVLHDSIEKIISNLLSNAIKYNREGGSIDLSITASGDVLNIQVSDTGIGMPKEILNRVFEKFKRAENGSLIAQGSGVGLSVVQEIVNAHGGTVKLQSKLGEGTKFSLSIPCVIENKQKQTWSNLSEASNLQRSPDEQHHSKSEVFSLGEDLNPERQVVGESFQFDTSTLDDDSPVVLVIEDDPGMRYYIAQVIGEQFQCVTATNGEEGIKIAKNLVPDIIVSDVMMPGLSGHQVCKTLKSEETTSHIPVLMLTARVDKDSRIQSWELLADEYLTKPFDDDEIIVRIKSLLNLRAKLQSYYTKAAFSPALQVSDSTIESSTDSSIDEASAVSERDSQFIEKIKSLLAESFSDDKLNVDWLAQQLFMSDRQLRRKLKALMGITPNELIKQFRIEKAMVMLRNGEKPSVVSFEVGFSSHSYFSQEFKKYTGKSPGDYV